MDDTEERDHGRECFQFVQWIHEIEEDAVSKPRRREFITQFLVTILLKLLRIMSKHHGNHAENFNRLLLQRLGCSGDLRRNGANFLDHDGNRKVQDQEERNGKNRQLPRERTHDDKIRDDGKNLTEVPVEPDERIHRKLREGGEHRVVMTEGGLIEEEFAES